MTSAAIAALAAGGAQAGGIDRSGQPMGVLFEEGNYIELGYGQIRPDISGQYGGVGGPSTGNMARNYDLPSIALKYQFNDRLSGMISYDHAYGADVAYPGPAGATAPIGGTTAVVQSDNFTALLRYKFDENWSVHGGLRASKAGGAVAIHRAGTPGDVLYSANLDHTWGAGAVLGGAYERPDIALRAAITWFSDVDHEMGTTEGGAIAGMLAGHPDLNSPTTVTTPQAVNIDLQSGIAKDTLAFFQFRWADWSEFRIAPAGGVISGVWPIGLVNFEDSYTYTLGVGRRFNENWSGSVFLTYEDAGDDRTTALSPFSGYRGAGVGVVYTEGNVKVTAGIRYMDLGDANAFSGGDVDFNGATPVGAFRDNHAIAAQIKVGFRF